MFSFNNPYGACPECGGIGTRWEIDPERLVPNPARSLKAGALAPWAGRESTYFRQTLAALAKRHKFSLDEPWSKLRKSARDVILFGDRDGGFEGVVKVLERRYRETQSEDARAEVEAFMAERPCPACGGSRLRPESLGLKIGGRSIADVVRFTIKDASGFFASLALSEREAAIARRVLKEIRERLGFLMNVGLDYLTLDRPAGTLSGGEGQRIRLATQIGSSLVGVLYILDEPSIGLHQRDNRRLLDTLRAAARPRQHRARGRARRGDDPRRRLRARPRAGRGRARRAPRRRRHARRDRRPIPSRSPASTCPARAASRCRSTGGRATSSSSPSTTRASTTCKGMARAHPARHLHLRHRRVGLGQVHARQRHPLPRAGPDALSRAGPARRAHAHRGRPAHRQGRGHRPVADRPHAALQPGDLHRRVHVHPRALRADARGAHARLPAGPLLLQRQGRALRGVPGRRAGEDRDALPARRVRHLRRVQGQALQPRDARGPLQGRQRRRRARHDRARGARLLRRGAGHQERSCRRSTTSASTTSAWASRRRRCRAARPSA